MAKISEIEVVMQSLLENLKEEQLSTMLDPCTKLTITLKVERGQIKVATRSSYKITQMKYSDLIKSESITEDLWKKIFSLPAFSEHPEREEYKKLRAVLGHIKKHGYVRYETGLCYQSEINNILKENNVECVMLSFGSKKGDPPDRFQICEIW